MFLCNLICFGCKVLFTSWQTGNRCNCCIVGITVALRIDVGQSYIGKQSLFGTLNATNQGPLKSNFKTSVISTTKN